MDWSSRFSISDFLGYLFPGMTAGVGLLFLLRSVAGISLSWLESGSWIIALVLVALSYVLGVILSGLAKPPLIHDPEEIKRQIPLGEFSNNIRDAFSHVFGVEKPTERQWASSEAYYYLCRSFVFESMPTLAPLIQRQVALRQFRMNVVPALIIWATVGILWGAHLLCEERLIGGVVLAASLGGVLLLRRTLVKRLERNGRREVREVLAAFLVGHRRPRIMTNESGGN